MKNLNHYQLASREDRFGLTVASRLNEAASDLPHDITERLRVARQMALARQPSALTAAAAVHNGQATLTMSGGGFGLWQLLASFMPLLMMVAGLIAINSFINDDRANELANIDAAILTDDLPPAAYADPGFAQFLKASLRDAAQ